MPNAKDAPITNRSVLLYGRPGCGKSTAALTFPGRKYFFICDPAGLEAIRGQDVEYDLFIQRSVQFNKVQLQKGATPTNLLVPDPRVFDNFQKKFDAIFQADQTPYDVVVIDSITMLIDSILAYIAKANNRLGKQAEIQDWGTMTSTVAQLLSVAVGSSATTIVTGHVEAIQDVVETGSRIENHLALSPKLRATVPQQFAHIIPLYADRQGTETHYWAMLHPDRKWSTVRSTLRNKPPVEDVTVNFSKPLEGQGLGGVFAKRI